MKILSESKIDASLFILSAGYGLISSKELIVPYNVTFADMRLGEVFSRLIRYIQTSGWNKLIENPNLVNSII